MAKRQDVNLTAMVCVDDFERYAARNLSSSTLGYFQGGADDEVTLRENVDAFKR